MPWILKGCPRCGGDQYDEKDERICLQCGQRKSIEEKEAINGNAAGIYAKENTKN